MLCASRGNNPPQHYKSMADYGALNSSFKAASQPVDAITKVAVDADSNDVFHEIAPIYGASESDGIKAITILVEAVATGGEDQNDLILNYSAFDGASMIETYEANHVDAYSQQYTSASVIEAPGNEMNYMLDASQISRSTTDESENLMLAAMMTVETVGL